MPSARMHGRYQLLVANCITLVTGDRLIVHVVNITGNDIKLRAGVSCGTVKASDDDNVVITPG